MKNLNILVKSVKYIYIFKWASSNQKIISEKDL